MKSLLWTLFGLALGFTAIRAGAESTTLVVSSAQGGEVDLQGHDDMAQMQRLQNQLMIENNLIKLRAEGRLLSAQQKFVRAPSVTFPVFPLRARPEYEGQYQGFYQLVNYVDLNPNSGATNDYNCLSRTYDGHRGVDYTLWPFPWWMMDQSVVEIIAAEYGVIVGKINGEPDRSCPGNVQSNNWNAVYVQHLDNSIAYYGHMKNGSLTTKNVGEIVVAGEYLGLVGSSGFSTHPHLHFEYHSDPQNADSYVETHVGQCRPGGSYWVVQRPYRESRVNMAVAHNAVPDFNAGCPNPFQETRNVQTDYFPGATMTLAVYLSDEQQGQMKTMHLIRPDGRSYSWTHISPDTYSASWWNWQVPLTPAGLNGDEPMLGTWRFQAQLDNGTADDVTFTVGGVVFRDGFE